MRRFTPLLATILCFPLLAHADEASHKAKAEEMITLLHLDRSVTAVVDNAMRQTNAITAQHYGGAVPPAAATSLADFQNKLKATLQPELGWDSIKPEYTKIIEDSFPEDQLDTILTFYKSPAGKALEEKMPNVQQQIGQILQTRVQKLQPTVRQMFEDFQKNLPPAEAPSTPPASSTKPSTPSSNSTTPSTTPKSTPK